MTDIKNRNEQNVCNECGRHCPLNELSCDRGRRAAGLLDDSAVKEHKTHNRHEQDERRDVRNHGEHENHRERDERKNRRERGEHENHRDHDERRRGGRFEHHDHRFDLKATGDVGLYARLRQCGHYLFHSGKEQSSQKKVLTVLTDYEEGITQRELTEILGVHRASASELLGKLEKKGLILRTADEQDRRQVRVCLTENGKRELPDDSAKTSGPAALFSVLTDEEKDSLYQILGKLIQTWGCDKKNTK